MSLFPGTAIEDFGERGVGRIMEDGEGGEVEKDVVGDEGDDDSNVDASVGEPRE